MISIGDYGQASLVVVFESELTPFAAQLCRIHRLAQNLDRHRACFLERAILLVILLQKTLCACVVGTYAGRLPTAVVAAGIALVELKLSTRIVPGVDEGDTEWPKTTMLSVPLLQITKPTNELLARYLFVVGEEVTLGRLACVIDEDVRVCGHPGNSTDHIAAHDVS